MTAEEPYRAELTPEIHEGLVLTPYGTMRLRVLGVTTDYWSLHFLSPCCGEVVWGGSYGARTCGRCERPLEEATQSAYMDEISAKQFFPELVEAWVDSCWPPLEGLVHRHGLADFVIATFEELARSGGLPAI